MAHDLLHWILSEIMWLIPSFLLYIIFFAVMAILWLIITILRTRFNFMATKKITETEFSGFMKFWDRIWPF